MRSSTATKPEKIDIAAEGAQLTGYFYPTAGSSQATLLIHSATGVPQRFYRHFAAWANGEGLSVMTYDYRDYGESLKQPLHQSNATYANWAVCDQRGAEHKLAELAPTGELWTLGHSLGGLGLPFRTPNPRISRVVTMGAGMAHYCDHPWSYRPKALAFWFLIGPIATTVAGYLPGRRLMLGADLPAEVYWQWRRWCIRRDFFAIDLGKSLPQPDFSPAIPDLRITVASDDVVVTPAAVRRYADTLAPAGARYITLRPDDVGLPALGHINCLGRGHESAWVKLLGLDG